MKTTRTTWQAWAAAIIIAGVKVGVDAVLPDGLLPLTQQAEMLLEPLAGLVKVLAKDGRSAKKTKRRTK